MALINKQKAIDEIRNFQAQVTCSFSKDWESGINEGFDHAVGVIELMEEVDAEPVRHGHWNGIEKESRGYTDIFECSECKCYVRTPFMMKVMEYDFCPSCGAKMDAQEKDDDRKTD